MSKSRASKQNGYREQIKKQKNDVYKFKPSSLGTINRTSISQIMKALFEYEELEITPDQVRKMSRLYQEKCEEVARLEKAIENMKVAMYDLQEENSWISCSERFPDEAENTEHHMVSDLVLITAKDINTDEIFVCDDCTCDGKWCNFGDYGFLVIAWQPLPQPLKQ